MVNRTLRLKVRRTILSAALGLGLAGVAHAQNAAGSIFGKTDPGGTIRIENLDTGTSREISADNGGRFTFSQLPTGRYRVTADGGSREVNVTVGTGTEVTFAAPISPDATTLERIEVTASSAFNPIDVSSVESTTVFTTEQIRELPIARDPTNVALLAPGTVKGDTGFGNLASFGGASVAENGYYINGFDVTNIRNFISYASLPFDAIGQQQIKTGGYGAEYGRSLGGVINIVTKRGTNDWTAGVSAYWTPSGLREEQRDAINRDQAGIAEGYRNQLYRSADKTEELTYNIYGGGPIVKDRLFFFGLVEGRNREEDVYNDTDSENRQQDTPQGIVKLDWNITDNHLLELTAIRNKRETDYITYRTDTVQSTLRDEETDRFTVENGGEVYIAKYTGYLTDNFTLSLLGGQLENTDAYRTSVPDGADCAAAYDSRANPSALVYLGCWNENALQVRDDAFGPDLDEREAFRIDAEWRVGDHLLRFGYDREKFTSGHAGLTYSGASADSPGGRYWRYYTVGESGTVNGVTGLTPGTEYVRYREFQSNSSNYDVINAAAYIEDSWQITDRFLLYAGLRSESFENKNSEGKNFVEADDLIAPRLGFSWDVKGDSSLKVFGNAGRYYIPVAANTNIRASGVEQLTQEFYFFEGIDPATGEPITLGSQIGLTNVNGSLVPPDPATVAATNLDPMYQDEYILGAQWAFAQNWTGGVRAIYRDVKKGMDDYCSYQAFIDWAEDNGYENFDYGSLASCIILNPGEDAELALDLESDGNLTTVTVPNSYLALPAYKRRYAALELFWERALTDDWYLQGSYTYAKSTGNIEGYVNSSLEQDDAGLTQDFDHKVFEDGAYGPLPNDRRHTFKLFGLYRLSNEWRVSGNVLAQSGRPVSCLGFIPDDTEFDYGVDYGASLGLYGASSFYCRNEDGVRELRDRGSEGRTPWIYNLDASVAYTPTWAGERLTLQMDIFNLLGQDEVTEYYEVSDVNRQSADRNPNYLNAYNFQAPREFRFTARYEW